MTLLTISLAMYFLFQQGPAGVGDAQTATPSNFLVGNTVKNSPKGTVAIISPTKNRLGSGCPISPTILLTAAHVWIGIEGDAFLQGAVQLQAISVDQKNDTAYLTFADTSKGLRFEKWYSLSKGVKEGEDIHIPLYDEGIIKGYYLWEMDGDYYFDALVFPGMSGSCILNGKDEVVSIVTELKPHPHPGVRALLIGRRGR